MSSTQIENSPGRTPLQRNPLYMTLVMIIWSVLAALTMFYVPSDTQQGVTQRIFYYHVPTAWVSFTAFLIAFIYSIIYLRRRRLKDDLTAAAFATSGWVFTTGVLITGPLWAKPIWGDYWNWSDQRLMSFFVLWLIFTGYLILRSSLQDLHMRARFSAVLAILGFLNVPLVYFAIRIWNTPSHPSAVIAGGEDSGLMDERMKITFWAAVVIFHLLLFSLTSLLKKTLELKQIVRNSQ